MQRSNLHRKADFVGAVETCYSRTADTTRWAEDVAGALRELFASTCLVGMHALTHTPDCRSGEFLLDIRPRSLRGYEASHVFSIGPEAFRVFHYPPALISVHSELRHSLEPDAHEEVESVRNQAGFTDGIGFVVHPEPGVVLVTYVGFDHRVVLDRRERERLTHVALHVESAFRLRRRKGALRAVVAHDGTVLDGERPWSRTARKVAKARDDNDIGFWTALVSGEVSVVSTMRGSRRVYEIVENAIPSRRVRALTKREVDVLSLAVRGMPAKHCAYALGISPTTVSSSLASAALKVGATSRLELLRIAALLARDPRAEATDHALTSAEQEILALLAQGLSNAQIAAQRSRSVRTIANQVAALLRKTGASSRRGLVTGVR